MSWKLRVISSFRRAYFNNAKLVESLKSSAKSTSSRQKSTESCAVRSLMDEVTTPEGCWSENYKRMDQKNTRILAIGVVSFVITMIAMKLYPIAKGYPDVTLF